VPAQPDVHPVRSERLPTVDPGRVAVVIPCRDEAATVGSVVSAFRAELPGSSVLVVDNASRDETARVAAAAGATVLREPRPGKGFAVLTGFRHALEADVDYVVMVDGDDTYPAAAVVDMLRMAADGTEMVIGTRLKTSEAGAFRPGHTLGNQLFILLVRLLFGVRTEDLFSGYRVLSRRLLSSIPLLAQGFEIEAELSLQAAVHRFPVAELPVAYRARPASSASKLQTYRDGLRILAAILTFFRDYKPLTCFGLLSLCFAALSLAGGSVVIADYLRTGLVPRLPLAVLSAALFLLAALSLVCGVLLTTINRRAAEIAAQLPWK
jgi:glycosyltransferase involved in cell wall biosynthesis